MNEWAESSQHSEGPCEWVSRPVWRIGEGVSGVVSGFAAELWEVELKKNRGELNHFSFCGAATDALS